MLILSFIGPPGSGKSTQINLLEKELTKEVDVIKLSVPNLLNNTGQIIDFLTERERTIIQENIKNGFQQAKIGKLAPLIFDQILLNIIKRINHKSLIILDGSPRGYEQAKLFTECPAYINNSIIINLDFQNQSIEHSVIRQFSRETRKNGLDIAETQLKMFSNKYETYYNDTINGLRYINKRVPIYKFDASINQDVLHLSIKAIVTNELYLNDTIISYL